MKRALPVVIVLLLMSTFLMAFRLPASGSTADPTVTAISGDMDFAVTIVAPTSLAGAVASGESRVYPLGYTDGSLQFIGKALVLSGVSGGSESVCFPFADYVYGWRGAVHTWTGSAWLPLTTSFSEGSEGVATKACTTVFGDGTYALLAYYSSSDAPVKAAAYVVPGCIMDVSLGGYGYDGPDGGTIRVLATFPGLLDDVEYSWEVTSASPASSMPGLPISGTYTPFFGYVVTSDMPYESYPSSMVIKIFDGDVCHAGFFRLSLG